MKLVVIESPYGGTPEEVRENLVYLDRCILDCLQRNESPYASHKMLTTALDDNDPAQRAWGIGAGLAWRRRADHRVFYLDRGWSNGMLGARDVFLIEGLSFEERWLDR